MPAFGPDLEFARRQGNKAGNELYKLMLKKYYLSEPTENSLYIPGSKKRWNFNK